REIAIVGLAWVGIVDRLGQCCAVVGQRDRLSALAAQVDVVRIEGNAGLARRVRQARKIAIEENSGRVGGLALVVENVELDCHAVADAPDALGVWAVAKRTAAYAERRWAVRL